MTDGAEHDNRLVTGSEFFSRAQERLTFNLPAALTNPDAIVRPADAHSADPAALAAIAAVRPIRPAAVLVPVVQRNEPSVLFTERTARLADHGGEISFPGGNTAGQPGLLPVIDPIATRAGSPDHRKAARDSPGARCADPVSDAVRTNLVAA